MRHLSTIKAYVVPRIYLNEAKKLTGVDNPGVYFLINDETGSLSKMYIGQTQKGISRLDDHNAKKDFWNKAIMFLADNKTFSLDMISGLEAYAIGKAHDAKRYKVENSVNPKYEIDEYDLLSCILESLHHLLLNLRKLYGLSVTSAEAGNTYRHVLTFKARCNAAGKDNCLIAFSFLHEGIIVESGSRRIVRDPHGHLTYDM